MEANATLGAPRRFAKRRPIISEEIDATAQGYRAQVNHSIFVGGAKTPGYDYYRAAMTTAIKLFYDCVASIVPGKTTCGELVDYYAAQVEKNPTLKTVRRRTSLERDCQSFTAALGAVQFPWRIGHHHCAGHDF